MTRHRAHLAVAIAISLFFGASAPLRAEDDISEISGEAAEHYKRGRELYSAGKYDESARELRRAYDRAPYSLLLYNIALAEWRAGNLSRALETAERADEADLPEGVEHKNRAMIRGLETRLTAATLAGLAGASQQLASHESPSPDGETPPSRPDADQGAAMGAPGWIGVGLSTLGAASIGGAIWIDRRMANKFDDYRRAAREARDEYERLNTELKRDQRIGLALLGAGVVSTGVGAVLIATDLIGPSETPPDSRHTEQTAHRVRLVPAPTPGGIGALFRLHW